MAIGYVHGANGGGSEVVIDGWNVNKRSSGEVVIRISKPLTATFSSQYGGLWKSPEGKITIDFPSDLFIEAPFCASAVVTNFSGMGGISIDQMNKDNFQFWVYNGNNLQSLELGFNANFEFKGRWK